MTKTQANIIIVLLILLIVALVSVSFHIYFFRSEIKNYEANLRAFLETLK